MPFDFILLGLLLICEIFSLKKHFKTRCLFCVSLLLILISYFTRDVNFNKISIDFYVLFALILLLLQNIVYIGKSELKMVTSMLFFNLSFYVILSTVSYSFLLQFNWIPFFISTLIAGLFLNNMESGIVYLSLSALIGEGVSCFITLKNFEYFVFFEWNFYKSFAILIVVLSVFYNIKYMAKSRRELVGNVVLCERSYTVDEKN